MEKKGQSMLKKARVYILTIAIIIIANIPSLSVYAANTDEHESVFTPIFNANGLNIPVDDINNHSHELIDDLNKIPTTYSIDHSKETINVSRTLQSRSAYRFENNPNASATGTLTESNTVDFYFFTTTDTTKFLLAQLLSDNKDYVAQLYQIDSADNATATNIYGFAGSLIQLNGLPAGDYALAIFSNNNTYGQDYILNINVTNPSANIKTVYYITNDLSIFMYETESGDIYGNGSLIYNTSTKTGSNLTWQRVDETRWESGYEQRTHKVFNVKVKAMSEPASYSSKKAKSDCVVLLYCDQGTSFSYLHTYYQSGPDHIYESTTNDTTGRTTPRQLDEHDFVGENEHYLVYDLNTGSVIDFYSNLNIFYNGKYEPEPTIKFY